ncbi:MAG TPA: hypothetical protein VGR35_02210 [Tepidisphaeraceae bacterium]|nr:hypothetical protein [Tepidisphaeraceae bacterium]
MSVLQAYPATAPAAPEAPVGPDHLAGGVLRSLSRSFRGHYSWGVVTTLVLGAVTFGVLPLLRWTQHFHRYVRLERQQLWHLAEWLRLQTAHPDAATLPDEAERIRWRGALAATAWLWLAAVIIFFVTQLWNLPAPARTLASSTFGARWRAATDAFRSDLFVAWTVGLLLAYALHWLHLQLHAGDVRRFAQKVNRVAEWEGVAPLSLPRAGSGAQPLWLLGALAMVMIGALWGVPLMLAGAVQRSYISRTSALLRAEAADRVRTMLLLRRPAQRVPQFARAAIRCRGERCRAPIPLLANFCARCGARAGTVMGDIA